MTVLAFYYLLVIDFFFLKPLFIMSNPFLAGMHLSPMTAPNPFGSVAVWVERH
jgi:hypothetical protein